MGEELFLNKKDAEFLVKSISTEIKEEANKILEKALNSVPNVNNGRPPMRSG